MRNDRYKLINFYSNDEINLYDLKNDPHEMKSLHDNPEYTGVLAQMKESLEKIRGHYDLPARPEKR